MNTYYVYFAAGSYTSDNMNLYNKYSIIMSDTIKAAKERLKTYFPGIKAFISEDKNTPTKYGLTHIPIDYELKLQTNMTQPS